MKKYRITKYNPKFRDSKGVYLKHDWTSISDIGNTINKRVFLLDDYVKIEESYIKAFSIIWEEFNFVPIVISSLEKYSFEDACPEHKTIYNEALTFQYEKMENGNLFEERDVVFNVIRLLLREHIWGNLGTINKSFVFEFGYDYYMYVTLNELSMQLIKEISTIGLYIEEIP